MKETAKKITSMPRNDLFFNKVVEVLENDFKIIKKDFKKELMTILIDCLNQGKTMSEAIVIINNLEE